MFYAGDQYFSRDLLTVQPLFQQIREGLSQRNAVARHKGVAQREDAHHPWRRLR
jgi:hypothetical protein